jgi:hypothetical protein
MPELMIFRAGKYPQGDWPKERVQKMVEAYDPDKNFEAPVVIGHRWYGNDDAYQYAHGWVRRLRMDGAGKVFAEIDEFSAEVKKAAAEKKLRYISVEITEYDKREEAAAPYLRAIALLGRDTPAVQGAKLPTLFSKDGYAVSEIDKENGITAFTHKINAKDIAAFAPGAGASGDESCADKNHSEEVINMDELEKLKAQTESLRAELAAVKEKAAAFQNEAAAFREAEKKAEAAAVYAKLRDEGKITPALFEKAVSLDAGMTGEQRKEFRALLGELNAQVDLSGAHAAPKTRAAPAGAGGGALTAKIRAYQKEKHLAAFSEAAEAMYAENPALFEDEGGGASTGGGA